MAEDNPSFCVLPWRHVAIDASGTFRICCRAADILRDGARIPSVYTDPIESVWQSPPLREVRRAMLAGEPLRECRGCYENERDSGSSARLDYNREWAEATGLGNPAVHFAGTLQPDSPPDYYHIVLGNLCNLACRMCDSNYSSRIKADPIHSSWAPVSGGAEVARWQGDTVEIAPRPKFGVRLNGFSRLEWRDGQATRWIEQAVAEVEVEPDVSNLTGVLLKVVAETVTTIAVAVGSAAETIVELPPGVSEHELPLDWSEGKLRIRVRTMSTGCRIGLRGLLLVREGGTGKHNDVFATRFVNKRDWTEQNALLFHEIIKNPRKLRDLALKGGEPMLAKRFFDIIDFLIDTGAAPYINLEIITNGTIWNADFVQKLASFRHVELCVSVDGFGRYYEYIRHPGHWETVQTNIERYMRQPGIDLRLQPVLQIYNALNIVELLRYSDRIGARTEIGIVFGPERLSVAMLPHAIRIEAAERLRRYRDEGGGQDVSTAIGYLQNASSVFSHQAFEEFVAFTNDLDASRDQSFIDLHGELLALFAAEGLAWNTQVRRFSNAAIAAL